MGAKDSGSIGDKSRLHSLTVQRGFECNRLITTIDDLPNADYPGTILKSSVKQTRS